MHRMLEYHVVPLTAAANDITRQRNDLKNSCTKRP